MADDTVKDMFELLKITKKMYPSKKYILFGFSYGSFLTQKFLEKYSNYLDGVVVAGSSKNSKLAVKFGKFITKMNLIFKRNQKCNFINKFIVSWGIADAIARWWAAKRCIYMKL